MVIKKFLLIFIIFTIFCVFSYFYCLVDHESTSLEQTSFVVDKKYLSVIQNLAKKESLEKIINDSGANLVEKHWNNFNIEVPQRILRLKDYKINGNLRVLVEKNDRFLGKLTIPLLQTVDFDKNELKIDIKLEEKQKNLIFFEKNIKITPILGENKTFFEIQSKIIVKNNILFIFKKFMDEKVIENNKKDIEQIENNLKNIVNQENAFSFPFLRQQN